MPLGLRPKVAIRINPDLKFKASGMGGGPQQFGLDAEQVAALPADLTRLMLTCSGSMSSPAPKPASRDLVRGAAGYGRPGSAAGAAPQAAGAVCEPGRGFGIPCFEKDEPLDRAAVGENSATLVDGPPARELPEAQPIVELRRYIGGEFGSTSQRSSTAKYLATRPIWW